MNRTRDMSPSPATRRATRWLPAAHVAGLGLLTAALAGSPAWAAEPPPGGTLFKGKTALHSHIEDSANSLREMSAILAKASVPDAPRATDTWPKICDRMAKSLKEGRAVIDRARIVRTDIRLWLDDEDRAWALLCTKGLRLAALTEALAEQTAEIAADTGRAHHSLTEIYKDANEVRGPLNAMARAWETVDPLLRKTPTGDSLGGGLSRTRTQLGKALDLLTRARPRAHRIAATLGARAEAYQARINALKRDPLAAELETLEKDLTNAFGEGKVYIKTVDHWLQIAKLQQHHRDKALDQFEKRVDSLLDDNLLRIQHVPDSRLGQAVDALIHRAKTAAVTLEIMQDRIDGTN